MPVHLLACKLCWARLPDDLRRKVNVAYSRRGVDPVGQRRAAGEGDRLVPRPAHHESPWSSKTRQPAGPIVDGLQITLNLDEGDIVSDALIVAKIVDAEGAVRLACCRSEGISWVERLGMLVAAERMELPEAGSWKESD